MSGGLFDPLGTDRTAPRPSSMLSAPVAIVGVAVVALLLLIAVACFRDDGDRGRPTAVSTIERVTVPSRPAAGLTAPAASVSPQPGLPPVRDDQDVEVQNGVRIVRPRRDHGGSTGAVVTVPDQPPLPTATGR